MAFPVLQAQGTTAAVTTGSLTVTLPAHQTDDILIVLTVDWVPNTSGNAVTGGIPSGWAVAPAGGINLVTGSETDGHIRPFWKRAASGSETDPVFTRGGSWDTGTDTCFAGRAYVIRGCPTSGNPWDNNARTGPHTAGDADFPAVTVAASQRLVVIFGASSDNQLWNLAPSGWAGGTADNTTTGTDAGFQTFRKETDTSTSGDTSNVDAPAQGGYAFYGFSFTPTSQDFAGTGAAAEADAAQAGTHSKQALGGAAAEADAAQAGTRIKTVFGGFNVEAAAAQAGASTKEALGGSAAQADTAQGGSVDELVAGGAAAETDAAQAGAAIKTYLADFAASVSEALERVTGTIIAATGAAVRAAAAQAGAPTKEALGGLNGSAATAQAAEAAKLVLGELAVTAAAAVAGAAIHTFTGSAASAASAAQAGGMTREALGGVATRVAAAQPASVAKLVLGELAASVSEALAGEGGFAEYRPHIYRSLFPSYPARTLISAAGRVRRTLWPSPR
jgi:hypothetical protein